VIVTFTSDPEGAAVVIDGVQKCAEDKTDCKVELTEGAHQLSMTKTDYFIRSGTVNVSERQDEIEWSLDPNFATLKVYTTPSSLKFTVNGEEHQGSYAQRITTQKSYRVVSNDRCFDKSGEEVEAGKPGEVIEVNFKPSPLYATIDVSAKSSKGEPLKAEVIVDGKELGITPSQHRVSVCAESLVLKHDEQGEYKSRLSLSEAETERVAVVIEKPVEKPRESYLLSPRERSLRYDYWASSTLTVLSLSFASTIGYLLWDLSKRTDEVRETFGYSSNEYKTFQENNRQAEAYGPFLLLGIAATGASVFYIISVFRDCQKPSICIFSDRRRGWARESLKNRYTPSLTPTNNGMTFGLSGTF
jgi:hypothetical protein